nr:ubiquitin-like domain-containing protein [Cellulomonas endophytica]
MLAAVTVASTAFAGAHREVVVEVDGERTTVEGYGRTVADVLAAAGVEVAEGDVLAPAPGTAVTDGSEIVVRHARTVTAEVDGETRTWSTTATTVEDALDDLGLRGDARASASRSAALGREPLRVSTPKTVHLVVDGQVVEGTSSAPTVGEALSDLGLVLGEADRVSVPLDAATVEGLVVLVSRAQADGESVTEAVPFETQEVADPDLPEGVRRTVTAGREGVRTTTYERELVGGVVVSRAPVASAVTTAPVAQVVHVGTGETARAQAAAAAAAAATASSAASSSSGAAAAPAAPPAVAVAPGSAQEIARGMVAARGWGDEQFSCLVSLWKKESGWNHLAQNRSSGAYGIPQSLPGSKMASAGADWRTNPATQIAWGLGYIADRYGTPCGAWSHSKARGWY